MTRFAKNLTSLILSFLLSLSIFSGCARPIISLDEVPEYYGVPYVEINGNVPLFEDSEISASSFEHYSALDPLGRCGTAYACIGVDLMPTEEREDIGSVIPSGWEFNGTSNNKKYDFIEDSYLYNRCHLIGFQLAGENANEKNLITGTRYMNVEGMLPFENEVAEYVETTKNHVMYRVTPIFSGFDYVAKGVLMEAYSVEDNGWGVCFCVYVYNVQPGVTINYFSGRNAPSGVEIPEEEELPKNENTPSDKSEESEEITESFILNTSSKKFHIPGKACANSVSEKNRQEYTGLRRSLLDDGYSPCGTCKP